MRREVTEIERPEKLSPSKAVTVLVLCQKLLNWFILREAAAHHINDTLDPEPDAYDLAA